MHTKAPLVTFLPLSFLLLLTLLLSGCIETDDQAEGQCALSSLVLAGFQECEDDDDSGETLSSLSKVTSYTSGSGAGGADSTAFDTVNKKLLVSNTVENQVTALDITSIASPTISYNIDMDDYGTRINAIAAYEDTIAVAMSNSNDDEGDEQTTGKIVFLEGDDGSVSSTVSVGIQPIDLKFSHDGNRLIVANAGQPNDDYTIDPEGSVSIINVSTKQVTSLDFTAFNSGQTRAAEITSAMRINGPNASVAQDLEPTSIAVSEDDATVWINLQPNNAIAKIDLDSQTITSLSALDYKDYNLNDNRLDSSDEDDEFELRHFQNILGLYMPKGIDSYNVDGTDYLVMANQGKARDYSGYSELKRIGDTLLGQVSSLFSLRLGDDDLGRLHYTPTLGQDSSGVYQSFYTYGGRSFSIRDADSTFVFDSEDDFATVTNSAGTYDDDYSDDYGTQPEVIIIATMNVQTYAFIGLATSGGFAVYDITDPEAVGYLRYESDASVDTSPQSMTFISADDSPNDEPLLAISYQDTGTVAIYQINLE